ncbi:adenylyl-sulfate kinase [Microbacterium suaedae]|uniref:adenylyl-sulfate kinase n=1 Tax=Microbacterium suaedae TaxID=2067813 RepID=UPI001E3CCB92|nr:adenylyl-sulfate kinase [Microbacterium suaedae]
MTSPHVTLSPAQIRDVELALAGAWGGVASLVFTDLDVSRGEEIVLFDPEGTDIASMTVETAVARPAGGEEIAQIGTGVAPALPTPVTVGGPIQARRPLGHLDHIALRATVSPRREESALLVTGAVPDALGSAENVIVLDHGDPRTLAEAIASVESSGREVFVLPAASTLEATKVAARALVADDIDVLETPTPPPAGRVILLTGLSGSGKSTISKLLVQRLAESDGRRVTLLDGDEVRLILSEGLGFSREDRMINVRRIGWVAALVARHDGIAVCAPIAPYEAMRAEMRARVEEAGRFLLVHISTPLEVCEQRDRKGLYAKARAGEVAEFTGISDPYQIPADADLTIDASVVSPDDAVDEILAKLAEIDAA